MGQKKQLFLHMGPGFHAKIEASIFEKQMPSMEFWNQPKETSFSDLVISTEKAFLSLKRDKIDLYAHCFGAQLAFMLAQKFPDKIGKIVILNSSVSPFNYFLNIGLKLKVFEAADVMRLKSADVAVQMETIFKIASSPAFNSMYWFSSEKQQQMEKKYFSQFSPIDLNVFSSVFSDFLSQWGKLWQGQSPWNGSVRVIYSESDVLLKYEDDIAPWVHAFPNASFESVQRVGHYAHLESQAVADLFFSGI